MRKQIITAAVLLISMSITSQLAAQNKVATEKQKASWDLKTSTTARVVSTPGGCNIVFSCEVTSPRDAASGQASGKRTHKPFRFAVSSTDNSVTEIKSPKDQSTGQSSGKVSYSDLSVMISMDKASVGKSAPKKLAVEDGQFTLPEEFQDGTCDVILSWSWGASNRCVKTFTITMEQGAMKGIQENGIK